MKKRIFLWCIHVPSYGLAHIPFSYVNKGRQPVNHNGMLKNAFSLFLCLAGTLFLGGADVSAEPGEIQRLMQQVESGPSLYRTTEAVAYFARKGTDPTPFSQDREAAVRSLRAAILLGQKGAEARDAVELLINRFPRAQHVVVLRSETYGSGEGSFEDWLQTYALSAKNKFLLSSELLEYATASICEDHIDVTVDKEFIDRNFSGGRVTSAVVDVYVVLTLNAGVCGLSQLTGQQFGTDQMAWRSWYAQEGGSFVPVSSSVSSSPHSGVPLSSGTSLDDVVLKGKYRMVLATGDELVGTVEGLDDTSVVFETTGGSGFKFLKGLVVEHELLALPQKLRATPQAGSDRYAESRIYTFDQLRDSPPPGGKISVRIVNNREFVGTLATIDEQTLRLNIEGSEIPFSKDAITQIATVVEQKPDATAETEPSKPKGPFDSLFIRNPETDEYGRPMEDLLFVGKILEEKSRTVTFRTLDGIQKSFSYDQISRRISHSSKEGFDAIARYGKPLFCPDGMILVDIPPGKKGRPFFKVCVDRYEYPNTEGAVPNGNVSYEQARKLCESQGKRLCTTDEWQWACSGLEEYQYPYGSSFNENYCNGEGNRRLEPSGNRSKCISKFGIYDMMGNIFEWVTDQNGEPMLMGGPLSKCQTLSPGVGGSAKPITGFRCCKSN